MREGKRFEPAFQTGISTPYGVSRIARLSACTLGSARGGVASLLDDRVVGVDEVAFGADTSCEPDVLEGQLDLEVSWIAAA